MILLYDAWQNQNTENSIVESNIPETVVESDRPSTRSFSEPDEDVSSVNEATDVVNPSETIVVYTDTLEIKISLSDGSVVSSRLLKYSEEFGIDDKKVQLLSQSPELYIARIGVQSKNLSQPKKYSSAKKSYSLDGNESLVVTLSGISNSETEVVKKYTFN
jgi:YidC/Oxa1 family membrane protein insertase